MANKAEGRRFGDGNPTFPIVLDGVYLPADDSERRRRLAELLVEQQFPGESKVTVEVRWTFELRWTLWDVRRQWYAAPGMCPVCNKPFSDEAVNHDFCLPF